MKRKIVYSTAITLGIFIALFLWFISPSWWVQFLSTLPNWIEAAKWLLPLALGSVAYFLVLLNVHNRLDSIIFKERIKVDDYIRGELTSLCSNTSCGRGQRGITEDEKGKLMNLFYTFIPPGDTERERAFSYWGDYFTTLYWAVISILALGGTIVVIGLDTSKVSHPVFTIVLVLALFLNLARFVSKRRLISPAQAQTQRIISQDYNKLMELLPQYRTGCEECPLHK